jgi:F-type H+-transporting ATPase subunit epsilon
LRADDLDEAAAQQAKEHAERSLQDQAADFDFSVATAQLAEASARLRTLEELKKRRR